MPSASEIRLRLWREGELLRMDVEDDGVGFDVASTEASYENSRQPGDGQPARAHRAGERTLAHPIAAGTRDDGLAHDAADDGGR